MVLVGVQLLGRLGVDHDLHRAVRVDGDLVLRDDLVQYTLKDRDFESNRTLYEGLTQRLRTAAVQAGLESTEIDVIDDAVPPVSPSLRPRSSIVMIVLSTGSSTHTE